jgi:hypothetical protein
MIRSQRGQTAAEFVGVLLLVAAIAAALLSSGVAKNVANGVETAICRIAGHDDCTTKTALPNATAGDQDGDGINDADERRAGLDPDSADTDGDGLSDGEESAIGTDPSDADSDGFDTPGDGLTDAEEVRLGSDPNNFDSDGDGNPDGYEVERGDDPTEDDRSIWTKGFETLVLDDPISLLIPSGPIAKALGKGFERFAVEVKGAYKLLRSAKTLAEASAARRRILALFRNRLGVAGKAGKAGEPVGGGKFPRFVAGTRHGVIDTADPALRQQVEDVVSSLERTGSPPAGVAQGRARGARRGVWLNNRNQLPDRPEGWYTESDVWPRPQSGGRGPERIIRGRNGEAWYSPDHYGTFRRIR